MPRNACARPAILLAAVLCLWTPARSQGNEVSVKGELLSSDQDFDARYVVELLEGVHRTVVAHADVRPDGMFEFRSVTPGEYSLTVSTMSGDPVCQKLVSVSASTGMLDVRLPDKGIKQRPGARTVSTRQLLHPPSKKAFRKFVEAQRLSGAGEYIRAAASLEQAVQESPDFAEAHVNLGAQYIRMGRFQNAVAEFRDAIRIAGPNPIVLCDLSSAQSRLGLREDAMESARAALRMDSGLPQAHLMLGALLVIDTRTRDEAIPHLQRAAPQYESARKILKELGKEWGATSPEWHPSALSPSAPELSRSLRPSSARPPN